MPSEMTTIDRARVRRLEEAFAFLASLHRRGVGVDIRRGRPIMAGDSPAVGGEDVRALDHLAEPLKEILSGQRKDWARDRREIVLAADPRGDGAGLLAALDLVERRFIANPLLARLDDAEALGRLAARLRDAQAVVAATTAWTVAPARTACSATMAGTSCGAAAGTTDWMEAAGLILRSFPGIGTITKS